MVHSALKRKRYSDEVKPSISPPTIVSITTGDNAKNIEGNPTKRTSTVEILPRTPPQVSAGSPLVIPFLPILPKNPRASIQTLLELMTPIEFAKLLRARVARLLAQWPSYPHLPSSHGLPSPTSSSSSVCYNLADTQDDGPDLCPETIQAFISFFRLDDVPIYRAFTLQELHSHLIALQTLLSFLNSQELRDIMVARLKLAGADKRRWATIQGLLDVLQRTDIDRSADSEGGIPSAAAHTRVDGPRTKSVVAADSVRRVEIGINTDSAVQATGEQTTLESSATSFPSPSKRVKVVHARKRLKTLVRKYPKTMKASGFLIPRPISAPINSKLNLITLHSPALEHTSRSHSAVHSALGASNATSSSVSFPSEHQHESLKCPESSVDGNPESLISNDSDGRANKLQRSESTVHRENISTTHIGACTKPLPRVEDTTANNALAGCKQASLPTQYDALAIKSYPTLVSPLSLSTVPRIPMSSNGTDVPDKRVTQSSDKPTAIVEQPSCEGGDDSANVDMDMSDDEADSRPVLEVRNGHGGLEPVMGTTQIGCQDHSMKLSSAEFTSTINRSATLAPTPESSQVSVVSEFTERSKPDTSGRVEYTREASRIIPDLTSSPPSKARFAGSSLPRPHAITAIQNAMTAQSESPSSTVPSSATSETSRHLRRSTPTFVEAQLERSSSDARKTPASGSSTVKPSAHSTLQIKRELLADEGFSAPDVSVNSKGDNSMLDSGIPVALRGNHMGTTPLVSGNAAGSDLPLQKTTKDRANNIRSTKSRRSFAKNSIESPNVPTVNSQRAGSSTGRTPPFGSKGPSNSFHSSVPSGRSPFPSSGPNLLPLPSAPRAMASIVPGARGVFFAPTGPPVTTSPVEVSSALRPEGPELPISSPGNLPPPASAPKTDSTSSIPKPSRSYSPKVQVSDRKKNLKRSRKESSPPCSRSRSSSVSISSSRVSDSRSRSRSPRRTDARGQKNCPHRLPRRPSISRAASTQTRDASPWSGPLPMVDTTRLRSKRSRSHSMSNSRSRSSTPRRRNYSYSRPPSPSPSPSGHQDSSQAPSRRRWSPDHLDRHSRGRKDRTDRVPPGPPSRRVPLHDHWSPGGNARRGHSSRSRWSSEESVDNAQDPLLPEVNTLAQPINPDHGGRRMTGHLRRA